MRFSVNLLLQLRVKYRNWVVFFGAWAVSGRRKIDNYKIIAALKCKRGYQLIELTWIPHERSAILTAFYRRGIIGRVWLSLAANC